MGGGAMSALRDDVEDAVFSEDPTGANLVLIDFERHLSRQSRTR
jgi:hypothetical protein